MKKAGRIELMDRLQNFGNKVDLFLHCRHPEIARDSVNTADSPGIKLGTKLCPLKRVNWQRREEVLLAGEGGGLGHV
jgi:hypothetical protein